MPVRAHEAGFTLVETLIALAVFSIAGLAVLHATSETLRAGAELEARTLARWSAQTVIAEARLEPGLSPGTQSGTLQQGNARFDWTLTVAPSQDARLLVLTAIVRAEGDTRTLAELEAFTVKP